MSGNQETRELGSELFGSEAGGGTKVKFLESVWSSEYKPRNSEEASMAGVL